jgi:uncharacterized RDD family membrane protein YckC
MDILGIIINLGQTVKLCYYYLITYVLDYVGYFNLERGLGYETYGIWVYHQEG